LRVESELRHHQLSGDDGGHGLGDEQQRELDNRVDDDVRPGGDPRNHTVGVTAIAHIDGRAAPPI
jgi:hypothetical protein